MSYNVGDIVRIKSLDWYKANKDKNGAVYLVISHLLRVCQNIVVKR